MKITVVRTEGKPIEATLEIAIDPDDEDGRALLEALIDHILSGSAVVTSPPRETAPTPGAPRKKATKPAAKPDAPTEDAPVEPDEQPPEAPAIATCVACELPFAEADEDLARLAKLRKVVKEDVCLACALTCRICGATDVEQKWIEASSLRGHGRLCETCFKAEESAAPAAELAEEAAE